MKKYIAAILLFMLVLSVGACFAPKDEAGAAFEFLPPLSADSDIYVSRCISGFAEKYNIPASQGKLLAEWVSSLETERREFSGGETPGDADGGEVYTFYCESGDFSYIINGGSENYILSEGEWYYVNNPSDPAKAVKMEAIRYDLHPMVMIDGEIYLDTGEKSTVTGRCGVMDGTITTSVEGSERPTENDQSNFGAGYEYQRVDKNHIDVVIEENWFTFVREGYEEQPSGKAETVLVRNFSHGESKALSEEDSERLTAIFSSITDWANSTADCLNDCEIAIGGCTVAYHSECGTFNDGAGDRSFTLSDGEQAEINGILEKYIVLGFEP